jgi:hypothetical protein
MTSNVMKNRRKTSDKYVKGNYFRDNREGGNGIIPKHYIQNQTEITNNRNSCTICEKHILAHEHTLFCSLCKKSSHVNCFPHYSEMDILYSRNPNNHWTCTTCLKIHFPYSTIENNNEFTTEVRMHTHLDINLENLDRLIFYFFLNFFPGCYQQK